MLVVMAIRDSVLIMICSKSECEVNALEAVKADGDYPTIEVLHNECEIGGLKII